MTEKEIIRPILVTGAHRSGTTWVGKVLSLSKEIGYINEPLSLWQRPGVLFPRPEFWFHYISAKNESLFYQGFENTLKFKYQLIEELKSIKSVKDVLRCIKNQTVFNYFRFKKRRPLVKEPMAVFNIEWFVKSFNADVVILIRHPAAFAGSLKKAGWSHPFSHFLNQKDLINNYLSDFKNEIQIYANQENDIIDQAILLWRMIYSTVIKYQKKYPNWIYLKHEDISLDPVDHFKQLFNLLNIDYHDRIEKKINLYSAVNQKPETNDVNDIKINSKANIYSWKKRLTPFEIEKIKLSTEKEWHHFYNESNW